MPLPDNKYHGGCCYSCEFHKGKVEFHHPISFKPEIGLFLCEAHHSLGFLGRHTRYQAEGLVNKSLTEMRLEIIELQNKVVIQAGYSISAIDKH